MEIYKNKAGNRVEAVQQGNEIALTVNCPFTNKRNIMVLPVTINALDNYFSGRGNIQNNFPKLTPSQREFIMTGITDDQWPAQ